MVSPILFDIRLTLYYITSVGIFYTLFSIHSSGADKENLYNIQKLIKFMIISLCLVTLKFDLSPILPGEIRCWSLLGVKGLKRYLCTIFWQLSQCAFHHLFSVSFSVPHFFSFCILRGLMAPFSRHRFRPSYGNLYLPSWIRALVGPLGSCDKKKY